MAKVKRDNTILQHFRQYLSLLKIIEQYDEIGTLLTKIGLFHSATDRQTLGRYQGQSRRIIKQGIRKLEKVQDGWVDCIFQVTLRFDNWMYFQWNSGDQLPVPTLHPSDWGELNKYLDQDETKKSYSRGQKRLTIVGKFKRIADISSQHLDIVLLTKRIRISIPLTMITEISILEQSKDLPVSPPKSWVDVVQEKGESK